MFGERAEQRLLGGRDVRGRKQPGLGFPLFDITHSCEEDRKREGKRDEAEKVV